MATKISLIGAGNIGGTIALLAAIKNLGNIVLIDIAKGLAKGKALDISHSLPVLQCNRQITGTASLKQMKDSKIIVITAGFPRKEGMSRDDLVEINLNVKHILLDNMNLKTIKKAKEIIGKKAKIEISGGINLKNITKISRIGVDFISIGAITQSAPAVNISLNLKKI